MLKKKEEKSHSIPEIDSPVNRSRIKQKCRHRHKTRECTVAIKKINPSFIDHFRRMTKSLHVVDDRYLPILFQHLRRYTNSHTVWKRSICTSNTVNVIFCLQQMNKIIGKTIETSLTMKKEEIFVRSK